MNSKNKLEAIVHLLKYNPDYALPSNLSKALKYLSLVESLDQQEQFDAIRYFSMGIIYESIEQKLNSITVQLAAIKLIDSSLFNWEDPDSSFTKYVAFILDQAFNDITPIEWAKILAYTAKETN